MTSGRSGPEQIHHKSRPAAPHQASRGQEVLARAVVGVVRALSLTLRFRLLNGSDGFEAGTSERVIFAIWHNRLALSLVLYRRYVQGRDPSRRMAAIVSASRDGGFLARILELFGVQPVRGSTSRRGPQALRELITCAERGYDLAITPDGPRGPPYVVQAGAIYLGQLTGMPIVPVSFRVKPKLEMRSWDRFQIPLPFAHCAVRVGKRMRVPREATEGERETLRRSLEETLRHLSREE